jgi:predicted NAD/FAD-dependent oxidoreductase
MHVVVVGAGIAGLMAAQSLVKNGHDVVVVDKGRSPGGRLATRRIDDATLDHGAQFFTVRDSLFESYVSEWITSGVVTEWCRGFDSTAQNNDGFPRYRGVRGMTDIAKHLAQGLNVRCNTLAFSIARGTTSKWQVNIDDGSALPADAVIVTCPLPQTYALLVTADIELPESMRRTEYDRTICLLVVLNQSSAVASPGGLQNPDETFSFIADNAIKGISAAVALTLHANPQFSLDHWDDQLEDVHQLLLQRAKPWIGDATVKTSQIKKWRLATPLTIWPERYWANDMIVLAGDAFGGPKIEGAALSGLAAANYLQQNN